MKLGDKLKPKNGGSDSCTIIDAPKPPLKWKVRYDCGKERLKTKSSLKKYYELINKQ